MSKYMRHHGEKGQAAVLLAVAMVGLLAIVGLALDGGMLYWNQRRAQNGADAAAVAGTTALISQILEDNYVCGSGTEQPILSLVQEYASANEVPDAASGQNVNVYYLTEDANGNRVDLINPGTGKAWKVGTTGNIPCADTYGKIVGLHVQASFPQDTFLAGVIGIAKTNVTVEAYAVWDHRSWCTDFAMFGISNDPSKDVVSAIGAGTRITNGGVHSNGGIHLSGGGQEIYMDPDRPLECATDADCDVKFDAFQNPPTLSQVDSYPLPDDFFYRFDDFTPEYAVGKTGNGADAGFIWNEVASNERFYFTGDILTKDVRNHDGTLKDGLYVTEGAIKLNNLGTSDHPWRATFVARGEVAISGGVNQLPMARNVFVFTLSGNTSNGAVNLSGDTNHWAGLIAAPNGNVSMSGAKNSDLSGMIIANSVNFSGSNNSINHRPEFCPPNPPRVLLVQ